MLRIVIVNKLEAREMAPQDVLDNDYVLVQDEEEDGTYLILTQDGELGVGFASEPMKCIPMHDVTGFINDLEGAEIVEN
jgi:hypothetical protein